jgi:myo-inositol 2-dehydrogenase/D-chiro-inositol 1-dehydrogenase
VHAVDPVPWLKGEPVHTYTERRFEIEPGKLLLHFSRGFASGALAAVVLGTHRSCSTPMGWWQVMGDYNRVEMRHVHEVR